MLRPFTGQGKWIAISVTTSASTAVDLPNAGPVLNVINGGASNAFICVSAAGTAATVPTSTAASTCTPVLANTDKAHSIADGSVLKISAIGAGVTTLWVCVSDGQ
jgi:phosphoribosylcarboxyaminoimidazole (NCAIR) mutase